MLNPLLIRVALLTALAAPLAACNDEEEVEVETPSGEVEVETETPSN